MRDIATAAGAMAKIDAIADLATILPGGMHEPPVSRPNADGDGDQTTERPQGTYGTLTSSKDPRANDLSSGDTEIDYRRLKIEVIGNDKATVAIAGGAIDDALSEQELEFTDADCMRVEPVGELRGGTIERAERTQDGVAWKVRLEYRIWRSMPKDA